MTLRQLAINVVPPPRKRVTWPMALPLVAFLGLFLVTCLVLDTRDIVVFSRPWAFVLSAAMLWVWWLHVAGYGGLRRGRALASLLMRLTVVAALVLVLAEPRTVRTSNVLTLIYALDRSDSIR